MMRVYVSSKGPRPQGRGILPRVWPAVVFVALCLPLVLPAVGRAQWKLQDTGGTKCYDGSQEIPCPPSGTNNYSGQDAQYNHPDRQPSYTDNGDGTVTDNLTELVWMKDTADTDGDGDIDINDRKNWTDAGTYCEGLNFAGSSDWHLPTYHELSRLVDNSRIAQAINTDVFSCENSSYWSGSPHADPGYSDRAWHVYFGSGSVLVGIKGDTFYVRCVRSGP